MKMLDHADTFEVLCLQAADNGRGEALFGDCLARARKELRPFMVGMDFPSVYLEFPLAGDPFLDVTVLYKNLDEGQRIDSEAAAGTDELIDWFARTCGSREYINFGFELDIKDPQATSAAVHFQPRSAHALVQPFCEAIGEPERAKLYLDLNDRLPAGWELSFFGMFRGRPGSPLRVCGYLNKATVEPIAADPRRMADVFDQIGFVAYDDEMLAQISELLAAGPGSYDFQFDIYPDGHLGDVFAIDTRFEIERPQLVRASFAEGPASRVMSLLERWDIADERWRLGVEAAFARMIPVELEDGSTGRYALVVMPQWVKVRWANKRLQPSKLYHLACAQLLG